MSQYKVYINNNSIGEEVDIAQQHTNKHHHDTSTTSNEMASSNCFHQTNHHHCLSSNHPTPSTTTTPSNALSSLENNDGVSQSKRKTLRLFRRSTNNNNQSVMSSLFTIDAPNDENEDFESKTHSSLSKKGNFNSIRVKTVSILSLMFFLTVLLCFAILIVAFHISFSKIEYQTILQSSLRVLRSMTDNFYALENKILDYAPWIDTANLFIYNGDPNRVKAYFDENFFCAHLAQVKLSFVSLYYLNGTILKSLACYNATLEENLPVEMEQLHPEHYFIKDMTISTTRRAAYLLPSATNVNHPEEFAMMVAVPVTTTDADTTTYGVMVFGRYQSNSIIQDLTAKTQVCISFYNLNSTIGLEIVQSMKGQSGLSSQIANYNALTIDADNSSWLLRGFFHVGAFDSSSSLLSLNRHCDHSGSGTIEGVLESDSNYGERISTLQILKDVHRENTVLIRCDISRSLYTNGINSFLITWAVMTAMLILLSASVVIFVELVVLRRTIRLTNGVIQITNEWNNDSNSITKGGKLPKFGKDEIGKLGMRVNYMLSVLEKSFTQLQKEHALAQSLLDRTSLEEQKYRNVMNGLTDFVITVDSTSGRIINFNASFENKIMGKIKDENSEKNVQNKMIHEYFEGMTLESVLQKLEELSVESGVKIWEVSILNRFRTGVPVNVTCSKVKIVIQEGDIIDAYVMMARNMSDQQELKKTILSQQQQFSEQQQHFEFEYYWKNPDMRNKLRIFCMNEKSYENFKFLEEVESYKKMKRTQHRANKQQEIISQFLTKESKYELNISQEETFNLVNRIKNGYGQVDLFDRLAVVVRNMLYRDTFQRFLMDVAKDNDMNTSSSLDVDESTDSSSLSLNNNDY